MKRVMRKGSARRTMAWILSAALAFSACPMYAEAEDETVENNDEEVQQTESESEVEEESTESESKTEEESTESESKAEEKSTASESEAEEEESTETESKTEENSAESEHETVKETKTILKTLQEEETPLTATAGNVTVTCPTIGENGEVTFHYYPKENETVTSAYVKGSWSEGWNQYFYMTEKDGVWSVTEQLSLEKSYEYGIEVNDEWVGDETNPRRGGNSEILRNPVYNSDGSVNIFYYPQEDEEVNLLYKTSDEDDYKSMAMTPDEYHSALLSATVSAQGDYTYCLEINGVKTEDRNCKKAAFAITKLPEDDKTVESPIVKDNEVTFHYFAPTADSVNLAGTMNGWSASAENMTYDEQTGFWSITKELEDGEYQYKFVVNGSNWVTDPRNGEQKDGNSYLLIGEEKEPVEGAYQYTIYYLDKNHQNVEDASLWIWTDNVNGTQFYFDEAQELVDGNTWLKAKVSCDYDKLFVIPRAYEDWSWQDTDKSYVNEEKDTDVTLYLIQGDATAYTELPEIVEKESRFVLIEYNRPEGDYDGWNIYSWNTGYGSEVTVDFEELGGTMVAAVPVVDTKESISFCMRRSEEGNPWAEKDGGDHSVAIPLDQTVVKATFEQGTGVTGNLPYNIGYKTDVANKEITFYYREDSLFRTYEEASLNGQVELVWDGEKYPMEYDEDNERYYYTGELTEGNHYYGYFVKDELNADRFNKETMDVSGVTYSKYTYIAAEAELEAQIIPSEIDYNDNAVLKLTLAATGEETVKPSEAYADLSALGLSSSFVIDTELMEGTIAVQESVSAGIKNIPVTVKDQYGNLYKTTAQVTVKQREAESFDWDEAVIYFAVTDRFFDGNSSNNDAYGKGSYDPEQGSMYHGGDFAGLESKLDYLQELGVNTIWITPVVENIEDVFTCDGYDNQYNSGYHGYWASDFTKLNQHLGTEAEFKALIDALHARGMKLMVDVVLNHAGYGTAGIYNNTYLKDKNMLRDSTTTVKGDDQKDSLSDLPDFVTEDPEVRALLVEWQTAWISNYDIDYFRVDTVKHVEDTTWKAFKNALTSVNPDFKMIGEYSGAGYATNAGQLGTGQMDSLLDFDFNDQAISFVRGNLSAVESFMENRNAGINNTATVGSFLGSHDEDGLMYRLMNEGNRVDSEKAYALMKVAATLQITAKGQPIIYYGEELGQTGANNWPYQTNRYDLDWSIANDTNDMLAHYTRLLEIRNSNTDVFAKGTRRQVEANDAEGILVAARSFGNNTIYVGFNINEKEAKQVVLTLAANTSYTDLYNGTIYQTGSDGTVVVTIPAASEGGTMVLKVGASKPTDKPHVNHQGQSSLDNSSDNEGGNESSLVTTTTATAVATAAASRPVEPVYTAMNGSVATGWEAVAAMALADAESQLVPLADSVEAASAAQTPIVNLILKANTVKVIPEKVVKQMAASGAIYVFALDNGVVTAYTSATLAEVKGDLDLSVEMTKNRDFGQGFKSIVLDPRKKAIYGVKIATVMSAGKENAGKTAYVFQRNLATDTVELLDCVTIDATGNITLSGVDATDLIVLYQ